MSFIKAPSDITILEYKYAKDNKKKEIHFLKKFFINCSFFTIGNNCNKLNGKDVINIISNNYPKITDDEKNEDRKNILNILHTRQKDIEKQIKCKFYSFMGFVLFPIYILNHFRYYDSKTKIIIFPFASLCGIYLGSFLGNLVTGRFSDYNRSKYLGTLPANVYLKN